MTDDNFAISVILGLPGPVIIACNHVAPGLADLNQCDVNHWFQSRFKSIDFFVKKI